MREEKIESRKSQQDREAICRDCRFSLFREIVFGDRHLLATAIRAGAPTIVTFNLRDFDKSSLAPWCIQAVHPADYLITLHTIAPDVVVAKLDEMVRDRQTKTSDLTPQAYLSKLARSVPALAAHLAESPEWALD